MLDEILDESKEIISDKDLVLYSACPQAYYLNRMEGKSKIPTTGAAAAVLFFLAKRKNLFDVRDKKVGVLFEGQRRAGPLLKHIEQMSREELMKYMPSSSAEAFGGTLAGTWSRIIDRNFFHGDPIYWNYANKSWELGTDLKKAGENYFNFILDEGAPVMGLVDKERTFKFEGVQFRVKIPEIRVKNGKRKGGAPEDYRIMVDHPTLFGFKGEHCGKKKLGLEESAVVTLSLFGLSRLLKKYRKTYLPKLDAPLWFWDYMDRDNSLILQNMIYRHVRLIKNETEATTRSDIHLDPLRVLIENHIRGVAEEKFDPNIKSCHSCRYNLLGIDGRAVCEYRNKKVSPSVPKHYFNFNNFEIEEKRGEEEVELVGRVNQQKKISIRGKIETITASHKVAVYRLKFEDGRVESSYDSNAFGMSFPSEKKGNFEIQMVERMDEVIQQIVDERGKKAVHEVNFSDFDFAGKIKVKERLDALGYEELEGGNFRKEYTVK